MDGQSAYIVKNPPDYFVYSLKFSDVDFFRVAYPISSSEIERTASGIRRLKTTFSRAMNSEWENDLNLIHMHTTGSINVEEMCKCLLEKTTKIVFIIIGF